MCHYLHYELGEQDYHGAADHCDHIIKMPEGAPKDRRNLWGICIEHHAIKTGLEAHGFNVQVMPGRGGLVPVDREEVIRKILKKEPIV